MAGAGFKTFSAGQVLSASDVNTYLMQQTVLVFASATARDAAVPSPSEGMIAYVKDVDQLQTYNGSAWLPRSYSQATGTASTTTGVIATNSSTTVTITFPSGRFAVAPILQAWSTSPRYICAPTTVAAGSATITVYNPSNASGSDATVYYSATSMSSGTAAG